MKMRCATIRRKVAERGAGACSFMKVSSDAFQVTSFAGNDEGWANTREKGGYRKASLVEVDVLKFVGRYMRAKEGTLHLQAVLTRRIGEGKYTSTPVPKKERKVSTLQRKPLSRRTFTGPVAAAS